MAFYYDERFVLEDNFPEPVSADDRREIISRYLELIDFNDDNEQWFAKVRLICEELNYALQPKKYKKNPELYRGSVVDVSNTIRVAVTGRLNSPDLWEVSQALGEQCVVKRLQAVL